MAFIILSFISCKKDKRYDLFARSLFGNWKAIQSQIDVGNGSTAFTDIAPQYNYYLNFKANNNFESSYFQIANTYDKYKIVDSVYAILYKQNTTDSSKIEYIFENEKLIISFQCIEACRVKLIRN